MEPNIIEEMQNLKAAIADVLARSGAKRAAFEYKAIKYSRVNKMLVIVSSSLSLVAAGSIASVLINLLNPITMQILAVVSASLSALASILVSLFFNDRNIAKFYSASSYYLELREDAKRVLTQPHPSSISLHKRLKELFDKYVMGATLYGEYEDTISIGKETLHEYHDSDSEHEYGLIQRVYPVIREIVILIVVLILMLIGLYTIGRWLF